MLIKGVNTAFSPFKKQLRASRVDGLFERAARVFREVFDKMEGVEWEHVRPALEGICNPEEE